MRERARALSYFAVIIPRRGPSPALLLPILLLLPLLYSTEMAKEGKSTQMAGPLPHHLFYFYPPFPCYYLNLFYEGGFAPLCRWSGPLPQPCIYSFLPYPIIPYIYFRRGLRPLCILVGAPPPTLYLFLPYLSLLFLSFILRGGLRPPLSFGRGPSPDLVFIWTLPSLLFLSFIWWGGLRPPYLIF